MLRCSSILLNINCFFVYIVIKVILLKVKKLLMLINILCIFVYFNNFIYFSGYWVKIGKIGWRDESFECILFNIYLNIMIERIYLDNWFKLYLKYEFIIVLILKFVNEMRLE